MMRRIAAIASAVVADARRRKVVWVVVLFAAAMAVAIPSLPSYGVGVVEGVFREVALTLTYVATMVVALTLSANRVPGEVEKRTVYPLLARDVRRWEYIVGTWLGIVVTLGLVVLAFGIVDIAIGWFTYGTPMPLLLQGCLGIWFEAAVGAAFCVAVSAVSGPVVAAVASLAFLFIAHARSSLLAPRDPLWHLYPSLDSFNIINPVAHGSGVGLAYIGGMILTLIGWAGALLVLAGIGFSRKDL